MGFFIALFGSIYLIYKYISRKQQAKQDKIEYNKLQQDVKSVFAYRASYQTVEKIREYINSNYAQVKQEFANDLKYIFGDDFENDAKNPEITKNWFYDIPTSLEHLILARDYKQMNNFVFPFYPAGKGDQTKYSLRLFKLINQYMAVSICELTLCPDRSPIDLQLRWNISGADFLPLGMNSSYATYPESRMSSWQKYC